jgi:23S rRNA (cytosine1962-C5)-methyltransferase
MYPKVTIHPISAKLINRGHPWIIEDQYTKRFPGERELLLTALEPEFKKPIAILLNDPQHKRIKARLWSREPAISFEEEWKKRLKLSLAKRLSLMHELDRQDIYLSFGELDQLPGLFILKLGSEVLIQIYCYAWKNFIPAIAQELVRALNTSSEHIWWQIRSEDYAGQAPAQNLAGLDKKQFEIEEFSVKYQLELGCLYDFGLYPDMACIRSQLAAKNIYPKQGLVLNLFCYTGALSLHALKCGASHVTSVDISPEYIERLEHNLSLNPGMQERHTAIIAPCEKALKKLASESLLFDLIICDPPSSFYNGKKRVHVLEFYEQNLANMSQCLRPGGKLLMYINTHQKDRKTYLQRAQELVKKLKLPLNYTQDLKLSEDAGVIAGFPESDYLKGFIFIKS